MWNILGTIGVGTLVICLYKTVNYIFDNCYLFKTPYQPRYSYFLVRNFKGCVKAVLDILNRQPHEFCVVGMDCEMTSTSVNGGHPVPAIIQIAKPGGYSAIFQLKVIERAEEDSKIIVPYLTECPKKSVYKLPSEDIIRQVLEDPNILKVGVAVMNDARYLEEGYRLICKGCLDLRYVAKCAGIKPGGLGHLAKEVLGKEKGEIKRKYKQPWESDHLNDHHIKYALQDARLGVEIFLKLNQKVIEQSYPWLRRLFWDEKTYWKYTLELWRKYIGKTFEFSSQLNFEQSRNWISYIPCTFGYYYTPESSGYQGGRKFISATLLRWCCVCGMPDDGSLDVKLKAIVPVDYRVEFEDERLYYICLCRMCFEESRTKVDYELRQELTEEFGAPSPDYKDHTLETAKKLAAQLLSSGDDSGNEWTQILKFNLHKLLHEELPQSYLTIPRTMEIILSMDCWPGTEHGRFVHDYFCLYKGGLDELRWRWCEKFYRVMRPQHLPQQWRDFYRRDPRWHRIMS